MERIMKTTSFSLLFVFAMIVFVSSASGEIVVGTRDSTVCCEKTISGLYCQNAPESYCATGNNLKKVPSSCESTFFCRGGWCYDSVEGTCMDNTPQIVCNNANGSWSSSKPKVCNLGCCIIGDQASFVTLVRCKRLSAFQGLEVNFNPDIQSEGLCLALAGSQQKGACVYEKDFEKTCKLTTKEDCKYENMVSPETRKASPSSNKDIGLTPVRSNTQTSGSENNPGANNPATGSTDGRASTNNAPVTGRAVSEEGSTNSQTSSTTSSESANRRASASGESSKVKFYPGRLCSDEELQTNCGPTQETMCIEGKEEVYFKDTCGNPANIYDASKVNDKSYWAKIVEKKDSCGANSGNANSPVCGNCNYLAGTYCREVTSNVRKPKYGSNVCASLDCVDKDGKVRKHGESWCLYDDESAGILSIVGGGSSVGSRYYRLVCQNGEIMTEPCADFRQEECIENSVDTPMGKVSQAACRVNRWQDCTSQRNKEDCTNSDARDCIWLQGLEYILMGSVLNGSSADAMSLEAIKQRAAAEIKKSGIPEGGCVPRISPGLKFWVDGEVKPICAQANALCPVTYEKGIISKEKCVKHCECTTKETELKRARVCMAMGDCGPKVNWVGQLGEGQGYKVTQEKMKNKK